MGNKRAPTQGRHRILRDSGLLIEDSNKGRVYRVDRDGKLVWEFSYKLSDKKISATLWGRYYYPDEIDLSWLEGGTL